VSARVRIPDGLRFDERGLVPVVVQDRASGDVLMLAWANAEALEHTAATGLLHLWSRSRGSLWKKGEGSGNLMAVREAHTDCDRDALVVVVDPGGPACHTGSRTCFGEAPLAAAGVLDELGRVVASRASAAPGGSYTASLLRRGLDHVLEKVGEESDEVVQAAKGESAERLAEEAADLLYHLLVALHLRGVAPDQVLEVLRRRRRSA
jgi:phosphoribosyl-AMP cyclohydrolase / phosphoribosyl-ATP pyrophosphohydrolase